MKEIINKIAKLIDLKSIITLSLVITLEVIIANNIKLDDNVFLLFSNLITMVITFYFAKKDDGKNE